MISQDRLKVVMKTWCGTVTMIGCVLAFTFPAFSQTFGGEPHPSGSTPDHYELISHGRITVVSHRVYAAGEIVRVVGFTGFGLAFLGLVLFFVADATVGPLQGSKRFTRINLVLFIVFVLEFVSMIIASAVRR